MNGLRRAFALSTTASLLAAAAVAYGNQAQTSATTFTGQGVGAVKIGKTFSSLYRAGLIGKLQRGCELGGPNTRSAQLRSPLRGNVTFTLTPGNRRVTNITLSNRGATARGVGVGSTLTRIRAAFPRGSLSTATRSTFGIDLYNVPRTAGGRFSFAINPTTKRATLVGVPFIGFCE